MNTQRKTGGWRHLLLMPLLCFMSLPHLAGAAPLAQIPTGPGIADYGYLGTPDYYTTANWANSPPLAKFVDKLPGLGKGKKNNILQGTADGQVAADGQYLPIGTPDIVTYPGTDYYEIELREYNERMHSDLPLPGTLLRGYVQVNNGTNTTSCAAVTPKAAKDACLSALTVAANTVVPDPIHYLGPILVAQRDRPVRIKFTNRLPSGPAGNLFIPVDTTVMGAGFGPATATGVRGVGIPCDNTVLDVVTNGYQVSTNGCSSYPQNRAAIHLHGGRTPWISDGTPHQWITPVEEITPFTQGVSLVNVPDMPDPGDGSTTYYFTNQQSARLMFYHDHAFGITRLNVYAGEAAGYLITDDYENDLVTRGIIPADQIPLIIQDKTFVDASEIRKYDPLWNWGSGTPDGNGVRPPVEGDLWLPHVYMPAQSTAPGYGGVNPFGRWMYGPWFYPATVVEAGPKDNPYYDPDCASSNPFILANCQTPGQPPQIPGTPNVSMGMEAFQDSAVVNGTAFPSLTVDPRAYRFRILNAASDRFQNLSFYVADDTPGNISPDTRLLAAGKSNKTEVKMVNASAERAALDAAAGYPWPEFWPVDGRDGGVPDPRTQGPSFLQIGTEGGFLPKPVEVKPQPITYNIDPTAFWVGNVNKMGLALGPAERADVIVDFSAYAGKTLILYNDAPAAWPARVAGYDYFTGAPDMRDGGGYGAGGVYNPATGVYETVGANVAHGILPGYAPNTRTVMQVIVTGSVGTSDTVPAFTFSRTKLEAEFTGPAAAPSPYTAGGTTLFERAQEPIIVAQAAYTDVYPNSYFPTNYPWEGITYINDQNLKFLTLAGEQVVVATEPKGIHDEMGASFDPVYGRMSGNLAMQIPNPTTLNANLILYGFSDVPTENVKNSTTYNVQVVPGTTTLADGTQIWQISHNGVDTHPIHFHIFDVQLINRVGWDGQILLPEPNELGWKDTVKISPLMDTIVAVRPRTPALPFGIPNSLRPLNPSIPLGKTMGFNSIDPTTGQAYVAPSPYAGGVTNILYNFGWEYVWHCHILSHEEMDMMRPIALEYEAAMPAAFTATVDANGVNWTDMTPLPPAAGIPADPETYRAASASSEIGFNVYKTTGGGTSFPVDANGRIVPLNTVPLNSPPFIRANSTTYPDAGANTSGESYIVEAFNAKGSTYATAGGASFTISATIAATGGSSFPVESIVPLVVTPADIPAGVTVTEVTFFDGQSVIATITGGGLTTNWNTAGDSMLGIHNISAKVKLTLGTDVVTAPITINITGALTADFSFTPGPLTQCTAVNLDASTSNATAGSITGYSWSITGVKNGIQLYTSVLSGQTPPALTLPPADYTVTLTIVDAANNRTAQITKTFTVGGTNTAPTMGIITAPTVVATGETLNLSGTGTDPDACDVLSYAWDVDSKNGYEFSIFNPSISYNALMTVLGPGTHTMTFKVTDLSGAFVTDTTTVTVVPVLNDFNADGKPDLLWRNATTGDVYIWYMNGLSMASYSFVGNIPQPWEIVGTPDMNGDSKPDLLWRNPTTGDVYIWYMNGATMTSYSLVTNVPLPWQIVGTPDINGDGKPDILWRNPTTGDVYGWYMNGATMTSYHFITNIPSPWQIVGTPDMDKNGKSDILWRNTTTGDVYGWYMNETTMTSYKFIANVPLPWQIAGTSDISRDGIPDLL